MLMLIEKITALAQAGNAESQYCLGRAYDEGELIPRNLLEAISWYQKAADQGHALACKALGIKTQASQAETPPF
jgi:TPR repeat protein